MGMMSAIGPFLWRLIGMVALYFVTAELMAVVLPAWVWAIIEPYWIYPFAVFALIAPAATPGFLRSVLLWTAPFWVWAAARYVLAASPIGAMIPEARMQTILTVSAPSCVALLGWGYWYFLRWQELSRTAILPVAMVYHLSAITLTVLQGRMSESVWVWALGSLALTFALAASMNAEKKPLFSHAALFCVVSSATLGVL
ncbi:hypothetical protein [Arhodomonas sp. SL1]|uniref:hypothetical protein n=1 Tax=Arhodomonas sp. SL1 TaxID=3425691 RepID=UPI003F880A2C